MWMTTRTINPLRNSLIQYGLQLAPVRLAGVLFLGKGILPLCGANLPLAEVKPTALFQSSRTDMPPSTAKGVPVTKLERSDSR